MNSVLASGAVCVKHLPTDFTTVWVDRALTN